MSRGIARPAAHKRVDPVALILWHLARAEQSRRWEQARVALDVLCGIDERARRTGQHDA